LDLLYEFKKFLLSFIKFKDERFSYTVVQFTEYMQSSFVKAAYVLTNGS